ncbi:PREDICTED: uncharacterized protein LOC108576123 [Habropoda laboriosa]|uniref:uncharacterized protein LOC108576123 n=1 Tax=Habropoda laboriosa TaxID=597456 RepID=UPI00083CACA0|nr:PREDICTED: uncharacterized protein LOC108576123 [Habropoda laboriosa]
METMQDSGGLQVDGSKGSVASGLHSSKTVNQLKIVESGDESGKVLTAAKSEMDPYKELELYLAKVNEEIGEIIESAPSTPLIVTDEPKYPTQPAPVQTPSYATELYNVKSLPAKSCTFRRQNSATSRGNNAGEDIGDWSKSILAEFNTIIANEINELTKELERKRNKEELRIVQYKELLNEFGISDSESSAGSSCEASTDRSSSRRNKESRDRRNGKLFNDETGYCFLLSSDYDEPRDRVVSVENSRRKSGSLPENLQDIIPRRERYVHSGDTLNSDYDEPNSCSMSFTEDHVQIDRNTSSLPSKLDRGHVEEEEDSSRAKYLENSYDQPKKHIEISSKTNEDVDDDKVAGSEQIGSSNLTVDGSNAKLPPRQQRMDAHRKTSLPVNLMSQKRRRVPRLARIRRNDDQNAMDPDYDLDEDKISCGARSLDGNGPISAPVTPTEEKKSPFPKFLWKKHTPVFHESREDVVLVRVSSLPDQDFLRLENETQKNGRVGSKEGLSKKRAVSPLTLRSDISAKRLSESDKDVRQVSPVDLKKFSLSRSRGNDVGVSCDLPEDDNPGSIGSVDSGKFDRMENVDVKKIMDEQNSRSGSLPISLQSLLSKIRNGSGSCCPNSPPIDSLTCSDMGTQTSPAISRSSSFTWVSDCDSPRAESQMDSQSLQDESTLDPASPQDTVDDDNRSSSSSQDLLQSMDEISSGSLSPDTTDRASPLESGIGTASPPRSTDRRIVKRLSTTASSSLSSGELLETPPRAPSSPSAASLQLKPEPLSVEMGGKSSSAPLLENNDAEKANGTVPEFSGILLVHFYPITDCKYVS